MRQRLATGVGAGSGPFSAVILLTVILAPRGASAQTEDVVWRAAAGVTVSGNDLTKTAASGWGNAGASSVQSLESDGFVEFQATGTAMVGLSRGDTDQGYADVDFAVYVNSGTLQIYESGANRGSFGTVAGSDRLRVEAAAGVVRYRKNGVVFYTSTLASRFPLLVDAALHSSGATVSDVRVGRTSFRGDVGVAVSEQSLTKTAGSGWNAGAVSGRTLGWGDGFVEFSALETDKRRAAGLSAGDSDQTAADIDFAIVLRADATVEVQESGASRGVFGSYATGDRFRVEARGGEVGYFQNGLLLYTSSAAPGYPLLADTALDDAGTTLSDIVVSEIVWANTAGVTVEAGTLTKAGPAGWNAGASSTASLAGGDGYVEFTARETNTTRACGLADQDTGFELSEIAFAIELRDDGQVRVHESGALRGTFGTYAPGDRFRVEVRQGEVAYRKNGVVFYTSAVTPVYPLKVDAALDSPGATLGEVRLGTLAWKNEAGVAVWGDGLLDTAATGWGYSGAATTAELRSGDGGVEFTATDTTSWRMVGLSNGDSDRGYADIDFALAAGNGTLYVFQKGAQVGSYGPYAIGDRLRVAVEGGVVRYRRNGALLYTSSQPVTYPLLVDTSLYTSDTAVTRIHLSGDFVPAPATSPSFSPPAGTYTELQTVTISSATPGAVIRYTLDGTDPVEGSTAYTAPLAVATTSTIKARAWKSGLEPSATSSASYQIVAPTVATPVLGPGSGVYTAAPSVVVTVATPGATIRYTTNGAEPTPSDPSIASGASLLVDRSQTVKAKAWKAGWNDSPVATATYSLLVGAITLSPGSGSYSGSVPVTLTSPSLSAALHYTTSGRLPSATDPAVSPGSTLLVDRSLTLSVIGRRIGWSDSAPVAATYALAAGTVAAPTLSPEPGSYAEPIDVRVRTASGGATLRYTLDGSEPGFESPLYLGPLRVDADVVIRARAFASDSVPSAITSGSYSVSGGAAAATPTLVPAPARSAVRQSVVASSPTPDATVRYTTDGAIPEPADPAVAGAILIDRATVVRARAWKDGLAPSATRSGFSLVTGAIASGETHALVLSADGSVLAWGWNSWGQLGNGTTTASAIPIPVPGLSDVVAIAAGASHSLALDSGGRVWAWGANSYGALGDGTTTNRLSPTLVPGLSGVAAIAAGRDHSLAVTSAGTVWGWGANGYGRLGDGTTTNRLSPVALSGLSDVIAVAGGDSHSLALGRDGRVWAWGWNYYGQLGDGTWQSRLTPVLVSGLAGVVRIGAGQNFSVALKTDGRTSGSVWTWGHGADGRLGYSASWVNRPALALDDVIDFAAGNQHSLVLRRDGQVVGWGMGGGSYGRIGDGTRVSRDQPVLVAGLTDAVALSAGVYHSAAIHADGGVSAWGYQGPAASDVPVRVAGLSLAPNAWLATDQDGDGLTAWDEWRHSCDPYAGDSDGDGVPDGVAIATGRPCAHLDADGDGLVGTEEASAGTSATHADTDGDGVDDAADCAPLDATRSTCLPQPGDHTPPTITLLEPPNANPLP
jgi:alpha-tubulin suppressor-like RCC1 family protein